MHDTQAAAFEAIKPTRTNLQQKVLAFLQTTGGATDEEIRAGLSMHENSHRARRRELEEQGLVVDSGRRRTSAAGRSVIVWVAA